MIMQPLNFFSKLYVLERNNISYYLVISAVCGCFFYLFFDKSCNYYLSSIIVIFGISLIIFSITQLFIYKLLIFFVIGIFYVFIYNSINFNNKYYDKKTYISGVGRIIEKRSFYNKVNHLQGINFILTDLKIKQLDFQSKSFIKNISKKTSKISKKKTKKIYLKKKKTKKTLTNSKKNLKKIKKPKKISKSFAKKIYNNYVNLNNYTELDRRSEDLRNFIKYDVKKNDDNIAKISKISLSTNYKNNFALNDFVEFNAIILPLKKPEFTTDYNQRFDALSKKINGFGYVMGLAKKTDHKYVGIDYWFLDLRQNIKNKILKYLQNDEASILLALLIGDVSNISKESLSAIRNAGLAHLLSISGFHLSLASAIFFVIARAISANIFNVALIFDSKKIASIFAIIASFFYLKISDAPLPAQRALIIVWVIMISYLLEQRFDGKRAIFLALIILAIINPYNLTQVGFQLSFMGVLTMISYFECYRKILFPYAYYDMDDKLLTTYLTKIRLYFLEILVITFLIQLTTLPILMHNFRIFSFSAYFANLLAIPLISFIIMPLAFISMFLMLFKLEFITLFILKYFLIIFVELSYFFNDFKYAFVKIPAIYDLNYFLAILAIIIILVSYNNYIKSLMLIILLIILTLIFIPEKSHIVFDKKQKFFAIYDQKNLYFSKDLKYTNQIKNWLFHYDNRGLKIIENCKKSKVNCQKCYPNYCELNFLNNKIMLIKKRTNIKKICNKIYKNNYYAIINFTKKFELPNCVTLNKNLIIIDNEDFINSLLNPKIYF
jgi:ComEC/Rec2-related protein